LQRGPARLGSNTAAHRPGGHEFVTQIPYSAGLHRLAPNTFGYLQPPGTWGYSNSGLVADATEAVLIDTQFTLPLTRTLLTAVHEARPTARITTVVTTHSNGDHCWGNQLLPDAAVVGSAATADEMTHEITPEALAGLVSSMPKESPIGDYLSRFFGHFDFSGITVTPPTRTFTGSTEVTAGGVSVTLIEVGPAHTSGDVIAFVPQDGVLFAGDILFIGDHPVTWTGPLSNWISACDRIIETDAQIVVPGHGPIVGRTGVLVFQDYLEYVDEQARLRYAKGMPYWEAALDIPMRAPYVPWGHRERLVMTLAAIYRGLGFDGPTDLLTVLRHTATAYQRLQLDD
jgi:glyoxylase-like metal-dependent hydrolase (beta-lactamase superfamily II)